jgi:hypothetical protein
LSHVPNSNHSSQLSPLDRLGSIFCLAPCGSSGETRIIIDETEVGIGGELEPLNADRELEEDVRVWFAARSERWTRKEMGGGGARGVE